MKKLEEIYDLIPLPIKIIIVLPIWIIAIPCFFIYCVFQGIAFGVYVVKNLFGCRF